MLKLLEFGTWRRIRFRVEGPGREITSFEDILLSWLVLGDCVGFGLSGLEATESSFRFACRLGGVGFGAYCF